MINIHLSCIHCKFEQDQISALQGYDEEEFHCPKCNYPMAKMGWSSLPPGVPVQEAIRE